MQLGCLTDSLSGSRVPGMTDPSEAHNRYICSKMHFNTQ